MSLGNILFVAITGFLFLLSYCFANNPDTTVRYCLPAIPFIIVLLAHEERNMLSTKPMVALVIVLFIFSAGYQAYILKTNIWKYKAYNGERVQFLKAATKPGDVIICDSQPLMEHSGPLFFERIFIVAQNPHELLQYIQLLKEKGVSRVYFWTFADRLPRDTSYEATSPVLFSSNHGPENYLFTLSLSP